MTRTSAPLKQLVLASMFVAIEVVLNSILVLQFQTMKLSFAFIVIALTAQLFSPYWTASIAAIAYTIGMILFPKFGFFPGFILTAFLTGLVFGIFLQRTPSFIKIMISSFIVTMGLNLLLNSLWLHIMYQINWSVLLTTRTVQEVITFVIYVVVLTVIFRSNIITIIQKRSHLD
ncbi:hypothetical protein AYR62_00105 [Secundilactobacillus paracollinoides]|uniref:Uncharacterized protein n=1 Tax=Secundilactobacillus paracollinoides TaxID=240427 RepID=A0A1B2IVV4_9LACO|nr:folate family ECF transporter S component [Secundilactobacillus paracollinoides]ANZ60356.1 hypothetical protein AYR61_02640 [Secundilactobacillus paracollinoides]ANZ62655.1 hypothetical protein AYR62_00105 [Secundilactobacillus paracollinoides]ANZ66185.1 hypothetical protein AYR63_02845 [Secundilactobacillus paracollinoides]